MDYKSSPKKLDALKVENGLQLQLLAYLNVLSSSRREEAPANAERGTRNAECGIKGSTVSDKVGQRVPPGLQTQAPAQAESGSQKDRRDALSYIVPPHPAGVFYVPLHGATGSTGERAEILSEDEAARRATYQHAGRFDFAHRALLGARPGGAASGQFKLRLNKDGGLIARGSDALPSAEFAALLQERLDALGI